MVMKSNIIYAAVLSALVLSGCSKLDANNRNFANVINLKIETLEQNDMKDFCFAVPLFPLSISNNDPENYYLNFRDRSISFSKQAILSLEKNGLISSTKDSGGTYTYNLTELGNKYYEDNQTSIGRLCYGQFAFDKIVKWEWKGNDHQYVWVTAKLKIDPFPDWAQNEEMQDSFSDLNYQIKNAEKDKLFELKLTSIGWEVIDAYGF
jgi:DNA-binding PadR family transcriptional regulator